MRKGALKTTTKQADHAYFPVADGYLQQGKCKGGRQIYSDSANCPCSSLVESDGPGFEFSICPLYALSSGGGLRNASEFRIWCSTHQELNN
ncbi:hypothetical protein GUJ93_ZPchr0002g26512 [Zizania palustris]|uniref:Uncharacterized protein n=1 Tax=Zizania palustris TaxID=103762 RepID=A0A8J5RWI6_ZIZPA|nr:hypothetical protein GUJ93_ZPchr0002g26512 [Zizania palustris]